ncbi:MAG: hypothetical protein PVJ68_08255 [Candidatus Thiodiazotropha sp.]|jgi:hypothetical protein
MVETLNKPMDKMPLERAVEDNTSITQVKTTEDELLIDADRKLTLRCGKSSITLYPNGKIVLRGEYILSDAEGVNRLAGGRIELN